MNGLASSLSQHSWTSSFQFEPTIHNKQETSVQTPNVLRFHIVSRTVDYL